MYINLTRKELKELLIERHDPDEIIEILNISTEELLDAFDYRIWELKDTLVREIGDDEDG